MGSLAGATLTLLLALFTLCGATPLGPCTSTGAQAVVNASGLCAVPVAPALSPVCGAQELNAPEQELNAPEQGHFAGKA